MMSEKFALTLAVLLTDVLSILVYHELPSANDRLFPVGRQAGSGGQFNYHCFLAYDSSGGSSSSSGGGGGGGGSSSEQLAATGKAIATKLDNNSKKGYCNENFQLQQQKRQQKQSSSLNKRFSAFKEGGVPPSSSSFVLLVDAKGVAGLGKAGGDGTGGSDKAGQQVPPEVYNALTYAGTAFLFTLSVPLILYGLNKILNKIEDCFGCGPSSKKMRQQLKNQQLNQQHEQQEQLQSGKNKHHHQTTMNNNSDLINNSSQQLQQSLTLGQNSFAITLPFDQQTVGQNFKVPPLTTTITPAATLTSTAATATTTTTTAAAASTTATTSTVQQQSFHQPYIIS